MNAVHVIYTHTNCYIVLLSKSIFICFCSFYVLYQLIDTVCFEEQVIHKNKNQNTFPIRWYFTWVCFFYIFEYLQFLLWRYTYIVIWGRGTSPEQYSYYTHTNMCACVCVVYARRLTSICFFYFITVNIFKSW